MSLTVKERLEALARGDKIRNTRYWNTNEYVELVNGQLEDEEGKSFAWDEFLDPEDAEHWGLYQEPQIYPADFLLGLHSGFHVTQDWLDKYYLPTVRRIIKQLDASAATPPERSEGKPQVPLVLECWVLDAFPQLTAQLLQLSKQVTASISAAEDALAALASVGRQLAADLSEHVRVELPSTTQMLDSSVQNYNQGIVGGTFKVD